MNEELTQAQKKKLERTKFVTPNTDMGMFAVMQDLAESLDKLAGAETVRIEGKPGKTPTKEELVKIIKPLIPPPEKGDPGYTPVKGKDYFDGKNGKTPKKGVDYFDGVDGKTIIKEKEVVMQIDSATIGYLESEIKRLQTLIEEARTEVKTQSSGQRTGWGAHPLQIQSAGVIKEKVARVINFVGTAVNSVVRSGSGVVTVTLNAGGAGSTVYNETPTGDINGINTVYTTAQSITTVQMLAINGQFIHPSEYTVTGAGFTMTTALPASLSGTSFTIVYV